MQQDDATEQQEELEVLRSIYGDDANFTVVSDNVFQYKFGDDGDFRSFLLELQWPADYPSVNDVSLNLGSFYNRHLLDMVKQEIASFLGEHVVTLHGSAMTFALIEYARENHELLMAKQVDPKLAVNYEGASGSSADEQQNVGSSRLGRQGKEILTKGQKRRMWDKSTSGGLERERGWNWVDIIKHLSQTGSAEV